MRISGVAVRAQSASEIWEILEKRGRTEPIRVTAVNPEKLLAASRSDALRAYIETSQVHLLDGIGVLLAVRVANGRGVRITGVDFAISLVSWANRRGLRVALVGGKEGVAERAAQRLREMFPGVNICAVFDGFDDLKSGVVEETLSRMRPDVVLVALGSPRQEFWIEKQTERIQAGVWQGVGGTFDVLAGDVRRAPLLFRMSGFEWLWRLILQPSRLSRQLPLVGFFIRHIVVTKFGKVVRGPRIMG